MLSKVFNSTLNGLFRAQPIILSSNYTFCTATSQRYEVHPLRNKIISLSSFDEFNSFFNDRNKQFDASCYSMASRTLAKILIESKLIFNFNHRQALKAYLTNLQKADFEAMNIQQFSQLLYLLRVLKQDPVNNNVFVKDFIRNIIKRSENKLKQIESQTNVNRLCYFYQEYSSLSLKGSAILAKRINNLVYKQKSQVQATPLNINEINLILKGMRSKDSISFDELILLKNITKLVIEKYFDKVSFFELAQISVGINEINFKNPNDILNINQIEQLHKKVLTNIDEMDQKSIMYILNGLKTDNRVYSRIYRVIFQKVLDEIQPNGECSFNELFTLRLFNGISDKVRLASTKPQNQEKFLAFFKLAITKTPRFVNSFLEGYVENGFLSNTHINKIIDILQTIPDFSYKLSLLHRLAKRKINITKIAHIDFTKNMELRDKNLIMMAFITQNLIENNPNDSQKYQEQLKKVQERFFELYKVEDESFTKLLQALPTDLIETLNRSLKKEIEEKFPNPFETEQHQKYRAAYLKYLVFGTNESSFSKKQIHKLKEKLKAEDLIQLLRTLNGVGHSNNDSVSNVLNLITKKFDLLHQNEELLKGISQMVYKETSSVFEVGNTDTIKMRYWNILNQCVEKLEPTQFFNHLILTINLLLYLSNYDLTFSNQYQSFLVKCVHKSEFITSKKTASNLIEECIKLNLIKRSDVSKISPKVVQNLSPHLKSLLKMIENNDYALEGIEITHNNLHLFLFNNSNKTKEQLLQNKQKVSNIIGQMKVRDIWRCLIHYRLGNRANQVEIVQSLLKQLSKYGLRYQEYSPIFIAEVFKRNGLEKSFSKIDGVKGFLKAALVYFSGKKNIYKIPLEDHIELIKLCNDFRVRNDDAVQQILNYYGNEFNYFSRELYLLAGNLGINLQKKQLDRLLELNFFSGFSNSYSKCFNMFLFNEKNIEEPEKYLKTIIDRHIELSGKEKIGIYSLYFDYLKKTYPEATKDWNPNAIENADFCKNIQMLNVKNVLWLREFLEETTKEKFVEHVISGSNYYYTFRNVALVFPAQTRYLGENNLLRRIISSLSGIEKVVVLNKNQTGVKSAIKYILQLQEKLLSATEEAQILRRLDQRIAQSKTSGNVKQVQEEVEEGVEEPVVKEQKTDDK